HRELRRGGPRQALCVDTKLLECSVDRAEVWIEHQSPNNADYHSRQHHRHQQTRAKETAPMDLIVQQQRETESEQKFKRQGRGGINKRMAHRGPEEII